MTRSTLMALHFAQAGECFYCGRQTFLANGSEGVKEAAERLGLPATCYRPGLARLAATREHLRRRAEGGSHDVGNLVMACQECNTTRGAKPVLLHLAERRAAFA